MEVRARQIEGNLQRLLPGSQTSGPPLDPDTMNVVVETVNNFSRAVCRRCGPDSARALLTVTDADAEYHAISAEDLADQWQGILEQALREALALRQPEAMRQQLATFFSDPHGNARRDSAPGLYLGTFGPPGTGPKAAATSRISADLCP